MSPERTSTLMWRIQQEAWGQRRATGALNGAVGQDPETVVEVDDVMDPNQGGASRWPVAAASPKIPNVLPTACPFLCTRIQFSMRPQPSTVANTFYL